jgi:hypothetical protein
VILKNLENSRRRLMAIARQTKDVRGSNFGAFPPGTFTHFISASAACLSAQQAEGARKAA